MTTISEIDAQMKILNDKKKEIVKKQSLQKTPKAENSSLYHSIYCVKRYFQRVIEQNIYPRNYPFKDLIKHTEVGEVNLHLDDKIKEVYKFHHPTNCGYAYDKLSVCLQEYANKEMKEVNCSYSINVKFLVNQIYIPAWSCPICMTTTEEAFKQKEDYDACVIRDLEHQALEKEYYDYVKIYDRDKKIFEEKMEEWVNIEPATEPKPELREFKPPITTEYEDPQQMDWYRERDCRWNIRKLSCGHGCCINCLEEIINSDSQEKKCPICRKAFKKIPSKELFI